MDVFLVDFPVSGVRVSIFAPPLVAFAVSFFSSMGGVSGAFLLLPYQASILKFASPSATSTNFIFNIVAIPSGVIRYIREGRMAWHLTGVISAGTLPGVFFGYYLRVLYLPDPRSFLLFVGCVLMYIALNLLYTVFTGSRKRKSREGIPARDSEHAASGTADRALRHSLAGSRIEGERFSFKRMEYVFGGERFTVSTPGIFFMALIVGIVGGAYGIGGGSIIAPFCVAICRLPVYTVAGAALAGTFLTSIAGVLFYAFLPSSSGLSTSPDWLLGILFGLGGIAGMYCGARLQKHVSQACIKLILALTMLFIAGRYILNYFSA